MECTFLPILFKKVYTIILYTENNAIGGASSVTTPCL